MSVRLAHNVCVSAVVPFRSRILSHETKRGTKIKTYSLHVTAPLQKHFVSNRARVTRHVFYSFENYFVHLHKTERAYWLALVMRWNVWPGNVRAV
jgi:hypothetical protein